MQKASIQEIKFAVLDINIFSSRSDKLQTKNRLNHSQQLTNVLLGIPEMHYALMEPRALPERERQH